MTEDPSVPPPSPTSSTMTLTSIHLTYSHTPYNFFFSFFFTFPLTTCHFLPQTSPKLIHIKPFHASKPIQSHASHICAPARQLVVLFWVSPWNQKRWQSAWSNKSAQNSCWQDACVHVCVHMCMHSLIWAISKSPEVSLKKQTNTQSLTWFLTNVWIHS